ncbi:MAG: thioredoxin family protein [Acidiferrobacterales bacterium]|nr:thioredoxin family protein [Acidiferrobacterales bacterium]
MNQQAFTVLDQFSFHHLLAETSGLAIVIFSGPACGSCKAWKQLLSEYRRQHPALGLFEVDVERDQGLAAEFSVFHLPALFLYRDGHYHGALSCEATTTALNEALEALSKQPPQEIP